EPVHVGSGGREVETTEEKSLALVDLRAIHPGAAFEIEPAIAGFEVPGRHLCLTGRCSGEEEEREDSSDGHRLTPSFEQLRVAIGAVDRGMAGRAALVARQREVVERRRL